MIVVAQQPGRCNGCGRGSLRWATPGPSTILCTMSSNFVQFREMCTTNCNSFNLSNVYNVTNNIVHQIVHNHQQYFVQCYVQY